MSGRGSAGRADRIGMRLPVRQLATSFDRATAAGGHVELVADAEHFRRIVREGILAARTSIDIMTADFKAMLVPEAGRRRARSIVEFFRNLAHKGVEVRLLHAGTPSSAA